VFFNHLSRHHFCYFHLAAAAASVVVIIVVKLYVNLSVLGSEDNDMSHVDKVSALIISLHRKTVL
jgi:hypothetical protein